MKYTLTPRLMAVTELLGRCSCLADIGTDHAYLPVYMIKNGLCQRAIASDIGKGPLARAEATVKLYNEEANISLRLGAGLDTVDTGEADAVSVAGMGGLVIAEILENGRDRLGKDCKIVLQPMTAIPELREYLYKNNWEIIKEVLAKEEEKIYTLMLVRKSDTPRPAPSQGELFIGAGLIADRPKHFAEYIARRRKKLTDMAKGLTASDSAESAEKLKLCNSLIEFIDSLEV